MIVSEKKETPPDPERERLKLYASWFVAPTPTGCERFGIVLRIARETQRSRHDWLSETLRVEPVFSRWIKQGELEISEYIYGTHYFSRSSEGMSSNRFALTLRCEDEEKCRSFAGLYTHVDVETRPEVFCGNLPGPSSGNFFSLPRELERRPTHPHGTCARLRACSAAANRDAPSCDGFYVSAHRCLEMLDCESALACFDREPQNPNQKLWSDTGVPAEKRRIGDLSAP